MKKLNKPNNNMWIFDAHQDIAIALMFTTKTDFFKKHELHDGSNNLGVPVNNQSDLPRLIEGNVRAVFGATCAFSIKNGRILPSKKPDFDTYDQINKYHEVVRKSKGEVTLIKTVNDLNRLNKNSLGILLHVEGADMLLKNPDSIETLCNLGVRSIGLTWNFDNGLAGGAMSNGKLSTRGKGIISKMEKLGIIIDLAHLNRQSALDVLEVIKKPCLISHTNCESIFNHPRNVNDTILKKVANAGGVVCISGVPSFVGKKPTLKMVCDHIVHAVEICGEDGVGLGSDFSVMTEKKLIPKFSQSSDFVFLVEALEKKFKPSVVGKICHKNLLRVISSSLDHN